MRNISIRGVLGAYQRSITIVLVRCGRNIKITELEYQARAGVLEGGKRSIRGMLEKCLRSVGVVLQEY